MEWSPPQHYFLEEISELNYPILRPRKINIKKVQNRWRERQIVQKGYYDRGSKEHCKMQKDDFVYLDTGKNGWMPTTIKDVADTPRSYFVESPHGEVIGSNSKDLYLPRTVRFQPEAIPGPSQPDTSLQTPGIECSDPEKPTEVRTRSGRLILTRKNHSFAWGKEKKLSFNSLKNKLIFPEVSTHYDPNKHIGLHTDASDQGLEAVRVHLDENTKERPISYASRTLQKAETNYSTTEKERLAIIWATKNLEHIFTEENSLYIPIIMVYADGKNENPYMAISAVVTRTTII
ncbi:hypothetical protein LAZ67_13000606 [Cordylochernes scorpioides]|uniref:Reverse transcriptase/retrotransposon-derived protein RNase H-like domain-containing protein n=1 Tax=Cordylochernes scorpioides TaxID=51811 RepID=A0ABY6L725_9ARAC|nr:hypothetical protein LAZ67_13000606 [Cordylochernes scorpioides]